MGGQPARDESSPDVTERTRRLERDVRDLQIALERSNAALEAQVSLTQTLQAEIKALGGWLEATSNSSREIAESRIWRTLTFFGGLILSITSWGASWGASLGRRPEEPHNEPRKEPAQAPGSPLFESDYQRWIAEFETSNADAIQERLAAFPMRPKISIVTTLADWPAEALTAAIDSLIGQSYPEWELWLAGVAKGRPSVPEDPRIRGETFEGDPDPLLAALKLAAGDFAAVLEPGGVLAKDALFHVVDRLNREPTTDVIYSDEDHIDGAGQRRDPFFKPDWSPDLILSMNYAGRLIVFRQALAVEAGPLRAEATPSPAYALLLRLSERTTRIRHIPRVLCHQTAASPKEHDADRRVLESYLRRTGKGAWAEADPQNGWWRIRYPLPSDSRASIIIPSGGNVEVLETNLKELFGKTDYPHYEIVLIDNSREDAIERFAHGWREGPRTVRYLDWRRKPFNFASICNTAARSCDSPFLLFLNDDTRVITPDWLHAMVELGARPEVGAVGARFLFPDGTIQHAGIVLGVYGRCRHLFKGLDAGERHYFDLLAP